MRFRSVHISAFDSFKTGCYTGGHRGGDNAAEEMKR